MSGCKLEQLYNLLHLGKPNSTRFYMLMSFAEIGKNAKDKYKVVALLLTHYCTRYMHLVAY